VLSRCFDVDSRWSRFTVLDATGNVGCDTSHQRRNDMRKFKIHFKETHDMSQIVEAESLDAAIEAWREGDEGVSEADVEDMETGDPYLVQERVDGEWKEVNP